MDEKLKPTPENINKDKIGQIPKSEFVPSEPLPMSQFIVEFEAKVHEQLEDNISGAITQIALENGIKYECAINKSFVVDALMKATPRKPIGEFDSVPHWRCPACHRAVVLYETDTKFPCCQWCGQKLKWNWSDEDE